MELTKLKHKLTVGVLTYEIDEPIGFDSLKTKVTRSAYHGISAEVSVNKLEFYDNAGRNAASLISDAFHEDIDTTIRYTVTDEDGELVYDGIVDLTTYEETTGNSRKVSVNVGEVGIKTTFNNRSEVEVDLNKDTTMSGSALATIPTWFNLALPTKTIKYVDEIRGGAIWNASNAPTGRFHLGANKSHQWINLSPGTTAKTAEFGEIEINPDIATDILASEESLADVQISDYYTPLFQKGSSFNEKFGAASTYKLTASMAITVKALNNLFASGSTDHYACHVCIIKGDTLFAYKRNDTWQFTPVWKSYEFTMDNDHRTVTVYPEFTLNDLNCQKIFLGIWMWNSNGGDSNNATEMEVEFTSGSYFKMELTSKADAKTVQTKSLLVGDALNKVIQHISDNALSLRSDWYKLDVDWSLDDTTIPEDQDVDFTVGGGALKAITNGYKIRGLYTTGTTERNMPMSFKQLIENLDAIDCIGWCFEKDGNNMYVRVEPWSWFYQYGAPVLKINNPNEKTREVDLNRIVTSLNIGYKKFTENDEQSAIDAFLTERTFTNGIKAVSKELKKTCDWIADTYAIEFTRRVAIDINKQDDEFKYDENVFLLELVFGLSLYAAGNNEKLVLLSLGIEGGISNATNIDNKTGLYNLRISPRRNAERWKDFIACAVSSDAFKLTSGKVNYKASYKTDADTDVYDTAEESHTRHLQTVTGSTLAENADIANDSPRFKAELLKIKYPLKFSQYKAIMADPYGIIQVDGEDCWLKEMQYELKTGLTEFTLIPKYTA